MKLKSPVLFIRSNIPNRRIMHMRTPCLLLCGIIPGILIATYTNRSFVIIFAIVSAVLFTLSLSFRKRLIALFAISFLIGILTTTLSLPKNNADGIYSVHGHVGNISIDKVYITDVNIDGKPLGRQLVIEDTELVNRYDVDIGEQIYFTCHVEFIKTDDSYSLYLLSENIGATVSDILTLNVSGYNSTITDVITRLRIWIEHKIDALFTHNAPMVRGILLGDSSYMNYNELQHVRDAGLAHILALSGLHISIISGFLRTVLRRLGVGYKLVCLVIMGFILFYCALVGFPSSLVRAGVMTGFLLLSTVVRRRYDSLCALSSAAILILLVNPYQLFSVGFLMSFGAMFGIILLSQPITRLLSNALNDRLAESVSLSTCATLGTLPPMAIFFHSIPTYGILVNTVAIPIASIGIITAFTGTILGCILPVLATPFTIITNLILDLINLVASGIASMPFSTFNISGMSLFLSVIIYSMFIICSDYIFISRHKKRIVFGALSVILLIGLFL